MTQQRYWLMKSEPSTYSIDDLQRDGFTDWEGVRNFQVRNFMRDEMHDGDLALFYHSGSKPPGVAGVCRVCATNKPDPTQWEPSSHYYDKKASKETPIWVMVEVEFVEKFSHFVSLSELKTQKELEAMQILKKGNRLSITPLTANQFELVCALGREEMPVLSSLINQR